MVGMRERERERDASHKRVWSCLPVCLSVCQSPNVKI